MKELSDLKSPKQLENKILKLLGATMEPLPKEFQKVLASDLVTAFESRLKVLSTQTKLECYVELPPEIENEIR